MKIYLMTDLEGATGVVDFDNPSKYRDIDHYHLILQYRKNLTEDINATVEAAVEFGVNKIIVCDGHSKQSVILEQLNPMAKLIRGTKYREYLPMFDDSFDALLLIGYHSRAGTKKGVLAHTNTRRVKKFQLNGTEIGEIGLCAIYAGYYDVPAIFISGDDKACNEAKELIPSIIYAEVKKGLYLTSACCESPANTSKMIKKEVIKSLERVERIKPYFIENPYTFRLSYNSPFTAPLRYLIKGRYRGSRLKNIYTQEIRSYDFMDLMRKFMGIRN